MCMQYRVQKEVGRLRKNGKARGIGVEKEKNTECGEAEVVILDLERSGLR